MYNRQSTCFVCIWLHATLKLTLKVRYWACLSWKLANKPSRGHLEISCLSQSQSLTYRGCLLNLGPLSDSNTIVSCSSGLTVMIGAAHVKSSLSCQQNLATHWIELKQLKRLGLQTFFEWCCLQPFVWCFPLVERSTSPTSPTAWPSSLSSWPQESTRPTWGQEVWWFKQSQTPSFAGKPRDLWHEALWLHLGFDLGFGISVGFRWRLGLKFRVLGFT